MKVNGINGSIQSIVLLLSPALGGVMMSYMKMGSVFFVDVVTAVIAVTILGLMAMPRHEREMAPPSGSQWGDLREGLSYLWAHPFLKDLIAFYFVIMFLVVPAAILSPLFVARTFGSEVWKLTANEIAFSAGATLGGFLMAAWGGLKSRIHTIAFSCIAFGVLVFSMGLASVFMAFLAVMFITGITLPAYSIASITLLQERVEKEYQGRVFGFVQIGSAAAMPLGMLFFGPLADIVKIEKLFLGAGICLVLAGAGMFADRRLRCAEGSCDPT
jgi:DHA3 family macrolide efflux protein-like MFS transporter